MRLQFISNAVRENMKKTEFEGHEMWLKASDQSKVRGTCDL